MAIAKMKQITLLAEQEKKDIVLKAVQELQKLELFDLSTIEESELLKYYQKGIKTVDRSIYEEKLKEVRSTLHYLRQYLPQSNLLEKLKKERKECSLEELDCFVEDCSLPWIIERINDMERSIIELEQKRKSNREEEIFLRKWQAMDFNPKNLENFCLTTNVIGTIPSTNVLPFKEGISQSQWIYCEEIFQYKDEAAFLIIAPSEEFQHVNKVLEQYQFIKLHYPYTLTPKEELKRNLSEAKSLAEEERNFKEEFLEYQPKLVDLELGEEYYYNLLQRENGKSLLLNSSNLFILTGWLEEEEVLELKYQLEAKVGGQNYAVLSEEIQNKDYPIVPVVLKNNKLVKPFESITEMYSLPRYDDVDPTPLMMPFYLVFFGMMSADVGYGLILFIGTFLANRLFCLERKTAKFIRFFHILSYSVILWGIVYGSFFGYTIPFQLLSTTDDVITILLLSVIFGFIQIICGLALNGAVKWKKQERAASYLEGTAWVGILLGIGLLVIGKMIFVNPLITAISYVLIIANTLGILLVSTLTSEKRGLGFALGLYSLYGVTGYIGDLVSYTRLMALGVSGGSIAAAFNLIVGFLPPMAKYSAGIVLFILLHALNTFLTYLSAYVHTARLQYVEYFGKFYGGGGRAFNPLKTYEKYIYLKRYNKKNEV